jgi:hypothetical protein
MEEAYLMANCPFDLSISKRVDRSPIHVHQVSYSHLADIDIDSTRRPVSKLWAVAILQTLLHVLSTTIGNMMARLRHLSPRI